ncbi:ATP-binding cassette domain-containing protein [Halothiobacillus sp.]|jgi:ABC-type iron transport system FetAB ATPase subunit|uniref:ABC transporter ATP-binding protein n=1 Tax=Halothiobacillus sp. TaxID=1891311 RepID=UPI002636C6BC|nr:ATP-binding cassette domain-containing protein [Halothiobacillus sp.]MDD3576697.1 ATP-binding cassette domain-containing protein [Halothiobacillus sp.]MDD4966860.1 ATP-binding cassette domain-containing protein [Halothiobacillus sp.]MDY0147541.1 ATP-binding cassette domain-containing protein [Halothiobacillus sp.]
MLFEARNVAGEPGSGVRYHPVSLQLEAGEILTIYGQSGIGKSQFLRALADLTPHTGDVLLEGISQTKIRPEHWRKQVGYVPAESGWWADVVAQHFSEPPPKAWLSSLSLPPELLDASVERLSTGERQRLALLRALVLHPKVLLLDEPTANLDQRNAQKLIELVKTYAQTEQAAVIWVSHDADERALLGNRSLEIRAETTHQAHHS